MTNAIFREELDELLIEMRQLKIKVGALEKVVRSQEICLSAIGEDICALHDVIHKKTNKKS